MIKSYYRYSPDKTVGVITSPECNVVFDYTGKLAFTGALQNVGVWNIRQANQVIKQEISFKKYILYFILF